MSKHQPRATTNNRLRKHISAAGSFASLPNVFQDVEEGVKHAVKLEFTTEFRERPKGDGAHFRSSSSSLPLETVFSPDRLLFDLGACDSSALNPKKIARDCEILKEVAEKYPDKIRKIVDAFQPGNSFSAIKEAFTIAKQIGLTEDSAQRAGGGFIHVAILIGGALLLSCAHNEGCQPRDEPKHPE